MARIVIVRASTGQVLGTNEDTILNPEYYTEDEVLADFASNVAGNDVAADRVFHVYRMPTWEGMTDADYYGLTAETVPALLAAKAQYVREVVVPEGRDFTNPFGL